MRSALEKLADEVREETAKIPRTNAPQKDHWLGATEAELFKGLAGNDPERSLKGILARIKLIESRLDAICSRRH